MNNITKEVMEGLIFSKYLYEKAVKDSHLSGIASYFSILTFHDSVEMYLCMGCIHNNKPRGKFPEFWNNLKNLHEERNELPHRVRMDRLNKIRNNLKHAGIKPSYESIIDARKSVFEFFNDSVDYLFGINYSEISLTSLINFIDLKDLMLLSEELIKKGKFSESVYKSAEVFYRITRLIENLPVRRTRRWRYLQPKRTDRHFSEEDEEDEIFLLISLNIDLMQYHKYKEIVKWTRLTEKDGVYKFDSKLKREITEEDASFYFFFVVNVVINIQEYE